MISFTVLTQDGTAGHPIIQECLSLIFLDHAGLIADLRHLNPGRPKNKFILFAMQWSLKGDPVSAPTQFQWLRTSQCAVLFSNDKAKDPVREPGSAEPGGVRGRTLSREFTKALQVNVMFFR